MGEAYWWFVVLTFPGIFRFRQLFVCRDRSLQARQRSRDIFYKQGTVPLCLINSSRRTATSPNMVMFAWAGQEKVTSIMTPPSNECATGDCLASAAIQCPVGRCPGAERAAVDPGELSKVA